MKKILFLLPLLLSILACGLQSRPIIGTQTTQSTLVQAKPIIQPTATISVQNNIPPSGNVKINLSYPSSFIPAMRVAFFNLSDGSISYIDTIMNQKSDVVINLPVGTYHVVAYPYSAGKHDSGSPKMSEAGGYTQMVPCGLMADCTDHTLLPITVSAGQTILVSPGDWYAPEGTYPPYPADK